MTFTQESKKIRIAVVGGGLAGATLINALMRHSHLDVKIYESAAEFSERGAAVSLAANAQREIGPHIREALDTAGAVQQHSTRAIIVRLIRCSSCIFR
jgi:salicylate hydroxylase